MAWVVAYKRQIKSDMSAIHHIRDIRSMPAEDFFDFAQYLVAYKGAMRMEAEEEAERKEQGRSSFRDGKQKKTTAEWAAEKAASKAMHAAKSSGKTPSNPGLNPELVQRNNAAMTEMDRMPLFEVGDASKK